MPCVDDNCVELSDADTSDADQGDIDLSEGATEDTPPDADDDALDSDDTTDGGPIACLFDSDCKDLNPVNTPCSAAICEVGFCTVIAMSDGAACDDGDACTTKTMCLNQVCSGVAVSCDDINPCTDDLCTSDFGCLHSPNLAQCNDFNLCTVGESCAKGNCGGGTAVDCDDNNACTLDGCNALLGCSHSSVPGSGCTDDDPCTVGDACLDEACVPGKQKVCSDDNPCTDEKCDSASGKCIASNNKNPCDDGSACTLADTCDGGKCNGAAANCDDKNLCTIDICSANDGCTHIGNTLPCDDGNECSEFDACAGGSCVGFAVNVLVFCDDGNACTNDTCSNKNGCEHTNNALACDDGNLCTKGDVCAFGVCLSGVNSCSCTQDAGCAAQNDTNLCNGTLFCDKSTPDWKCKVNPATVVTCDTKGDGECTENLCNKVTGKCGYVSTNEGKQCDADGTVCTPGDVCASGTCVAGKILSCNDNNPCTNDSCDAVDGCKFGINANPCSDGSACTVGDLCKNSACVPGNLNVCADGNSCTDDICDPLTGGCLFKVNTTPCDDGNACSQNDKCVNGICGGLSVGCDDKNICTNDSCSPKTGCINAANAVPCDDGNACTANDTCGGGGCKGNAITPATLCDDGNPCTTEACDVLKGCVHNTNSASCDDGNGCTVGDVCSAGVCASGSNTCGCAKNSDCAAQEDGNFCNGTLVCDISALPYKCKIDAATVVSCDTSGDTFCTKNTCAVATGKCNYISQNEGLGCNADNSVCTVGDACKVGVCLPGATVNCDDSNVCTDDNCNAISGCTHVANVSPCTDGNACTLGDVCNASACDPGGLKNCNDSNPCTTDSCTVATGICLNGNNSIVCDDGNACTSGDKCSGGSCLSVSISCDDGKVCTNDSCDPKTGCVQIANILPCTDGNVCTTGDVCSGGVCGATGALNCNDGNPCSSDSCNPLTGCANVANTASCDDGNACTSGDACAAKVCAGGAITCNDGVFCTSDSCNTATGCIYTNNAFPCDDSNACTTGDTCGAGACKGPAVVVATYCNDSNACTTDGCNSVTGCTHSNNTLACDDGNGCTTGDVCGGGVCISGSNTCGCTKDADCAAKEDGNFCNGTLFCDKSALPFDCKVKAVTIVTCSAAGDTVCKTNTCTPATGACSYVGINPGGPCNADSSVCTNPDVCSGVNCNAGAVLNCDDGNSCTNDACDSVVGCTHTNNGNACSDGNACTAGDVCKAGACTSGAVAVCNDGNVCTIDSCNVLTGACVFNGAAANGASCDADGSVCSVGDTCNTGVCKPGAALNCDDLNACTDDSCSPLGGCAHAANNKACSDGNNCTGPDTCSGGSCNGPALNCDDINPCTFDGCSAVTGCTHTNAADKTICNSTGICQTGVCVAGKCGDGVLMPILGEQCDDGNTVNFDGCSSTCKIEDNACADGTREGLMDAVNFPKIAQCNGNWLGAISASGAGTGAALCGAAFHVCTFGDQASLKSIPQPIAFQAGCWAMNASNHGSQCQACISGKSDEMAGLGGGCQGKIVNSGTSCISVNYRIDASTGTCSNTGNNIPWVLGVMCCAN